MPISEGDNVLTRKAAPIRILLAMVLVTLCGCQSNGPAGPVYNSNAAIKVNILKSSLIDQISQINLRVVSMDAVVYTDTTNLQNGGFAFDPFELPEGQAFFLISASDVSGRVLYQGSTTASIVSGVENEITVVLLPAIPMVKLSPYYQSIASGQQFTTTIELFNIQRFFNGSFKIAYDPDMLAYEDIAQQADPSWGELIIFARDTGDTVVVSVSRIQGISDEIPPNVFALLNLQFRTIQPTSTDLRLTVDVLDDIDGPVSEFAGLYIDHQTIVVTGAGNQ